MSNKIKFKYPDADNLYNIVIEAETKEIADAIYEELQKYKIEKK